MGSVYQRSDWFCRTCGERKAKTADRETCAAAGHRLDERHSDIWWVQYRRAGRSYAESSKSARKKDALELLRQREGAISSGQPVTPKMGRVTLDDAADDLLHDYRINGKKSLEVVERRVRKHLLPYFSGWKLAAISTADVRAYVAARQEQGVVHHRTGERLGGVSNAEINRELALLKRAFSLAIQAGKLLHRPYIPMLREDNARQGFFEPDQLDSVVAQLPEPIRPVIRFASLTGWRIASEVLPLEWRQVDFEAGEVRLYAGTTKNRDGRVFPMTAELRGLLQQRHTEHLRWKKAGHICPFVFFREVAESRGGPKKPKRITSFTNGWKAACRRAGCPGRIPHDLRRTAARSFVRAGIPERVAMMLTGHKTRSVFERYNIVSETDLRDAARRLDSAPAALGRAVESKS